MVLHQRAVYNICTIFEVICITNTTKLKKASNKKEQNVFTRANLHEVYEAIKTESCCKCNFHRRMLAPMRLLMS